MSSEIVEDFADLHQGGAVADAGDEFRPRKDPDGKPTAHEGPAFIAAVQDHLYGDYPLGVYPLLPTTPPTVWWGAVDWDVDKDRDYPEHSLIHAANVSNVLDMYGMVSFTEISRSKGVHLWVYAKEPVEAKTMRNALMAACLIVKAPVNEVYPKQVALSGKGFGNGIRLPYPNIGRPGKQIIRRGSWTLSLDEFVREAMNNRYPATKFEELTELAPKAVTPSPVPQRKLSWRRKSIGRVSQGILDNGPAMIDGKVDRSKSMFTLAIGLVRAGYSQAEAISTLSEWDDRFARKFTDRPDAEQRYAEMVAAAERRHRADQGVLRGT
tara:strand:+ start:907 stop:1878 length:972 start_codon:yes stop_codon:yes gene_type:complete